MSEDTTVEATQPAAGAATVPGGRIGRYAVLEALGQGGMGVVLAAYDPDLDRRVALKLLRAVGGDRDGALVREARAMAKVTHPNVLTVHEVGTVDGTTFIAMAYVSGGTLRRWLATRPPWREVLARFVEAGRGLAAAHAAGLIHRDFKPENVLISRDGVAQVADFGLVSAPATVGEVAGTPAYMAPEQRAGAEVGPAADQYAFCVSLWEGLHGVRPPDTGDAEVPAWLREVVRRGLRDAPEARWPSMAALLDALGRDPVATRRQRLRTAGLAGAALLLGGVVVFAATGSTAEDTRCRGMDRHLRGIWDPPRIAALRGALGEGDAAARATTALDRYTAAWVGARTGACEATHVRGEQSEALLDLRMRCLDRRLVEVDTLVEVLATPGSDLGVRAADAIARLAPLEQCDDVDALQAVVPPPADPAARARVDELGRDIATAEALERTGQFRDGLALARRVSDDAVALGHAPLVAQALAIRALLEERNGDVEAAIATAEQGMLAAADAHDDLLGVRLCSDQVFFVGYRQARKEEGLRLRTRCDVALRRAGTPAYHEARLTNSYGLMYTAMNDLDEAQRLLERAVALWEAHLGPDDIETATSLNNLANVFDAAQRYDDARRTQERSIAIRERVLGPDHPDVAMSLGNLANEYTGLGDFATAQQIHERALAIHEKAHGPFHPDVALALANLAVTHFHQGDLAGARGLYARAIEVAEKAGSPDGSELTLALANQGQTLLLLGEVAEARRHLERAREVVTAHLGADHPFMTWALGPLGEVALAEGKPDEARLHLARAAAIIEAAYGADHPALAEVTAAQAKAALALGAPDQALALAEKAVRLGEAGGLRAIDLASLRFVHARALAPGDPAKALAIAREVRDVLAAAAPAGAYTLAEVDAWLGSREQ